MNILEETKQFLSGTVLTTISQTLGESEAATRKAIAALVPTILTKALTIADYDPSGTKLFDILRTASQQGVIPSSPADFTEASTLTKLFSTVGAGQLVETVLGNKIHTTTEAVSALSGVKRTSVTGLLAICVPAALGVIRNFLASQPDAKLALIDLTATQLAQLKNIVPSQLVEVSLTPQSVPANDMPAKKLPSYATKTAGNVVVPAAASRPSNLGWVAPVVFVVALLGGLWYYFRAQQLATHSSQLSQQQLDVTTAKNLPDETLEKFKDARKNDTATNNGSDVAAINEGTSKVLASADIPALVADDKKNIADTTTGEVQKPVDNAAMQSENSGTSNTLTKTNEPAPAPAQVARNNTLPVIGAPEEHVDAVLNPVVKPQDVVPNPAVAGALNDGTAHVTLPSGQELLVQKGSFIDSLLHAFKNPADNTNAKFIFDKVAFESSSPKIIKGSTDQLDDLVKVLQAYGSTAIKVTGFTDASGDAERNKNLSYGRAKMVRQYLSKNGIDEQRISVNGEGQNNPIASNDTPAGRALNRRIEIALVRK